MPDSPDHVVTVENHRSGRYRAVCTCGQYRSKSYYFPGLAEAAGWDHTKAKSTDPSLTEI
jgi:hypothetical protein